MRIILHHGPLGTNTKRLPKLPDETFVFVCIEDFSVGPLSDWQDRAKFQESRSDFWQRTELLTLPDGSKNQYFVWHQSLPRFDLVEMMKGGIAVEDIPMPQNLNELIPTAKTVEIWYDLTVRGHVFLWHTVAALQDYRIDPKLVAACVLSDHPKEEPRKFWSGMLLDKVDRAIPAIRIPEREWRLALRYWDALTKLPRPVEQTLIQGAEEPVRKVLATISRRHPIEALGLSNIQERLLRSTRREWQKMAMTIGNAMVAGYEEHDPVGDFVLQFELSEMARMTPPLVEVDGEGAMQFCRVRLTSHGETELRSLSA